MVLKVSWIPLGFTILPRSEMISLAFGLLMGFFSLSTWEGGQVGLALGRFHRMEFTYSMPVSQAFTIASVSHHCQKSKRLWRS
jgi:hypothetical protein